MDLIQIGSRPEGPGRRGEIPGSRFPGDIVYPTGLVPNPLMPETEGGVRSLMPNQALRNGSSDVPLDLGDHVFYHPWEGNALAWLNTAEIARGEVLLDRWPTFRDGCTTVCGAL